MLGEVAPDGTSQGEASGGADPRLAAALERVLEAARSVDERADTTLIERAFARALIAHAGQLRKSGEPYLVHPLRVAGTLAGLGLDVDTIAAGILHDSVEDSELTVFELEESFGRTVASIVDGVTKLGKVPYLSRKEQQAESFRKLLLAMSQDIRVLIVKLCDRLDNMRTLEHMPDDKRERIARETADIYVPLAARLGLEEIRSELADLSFRYLEPVAYDHTRARIAELLATHPDFCDQQLERLRWAFRDPPTEDLERWDEARSGSIELRASRRTVYEVFQGAELAKNQRRRRTDRLGEAATGDEPAADTELEQVSDLFVYHVVTTSRAACYLALGQVHAVFKPAPNGFRDYIALARRQRAEGLRTVVVDRSGARLELWIRSEDMDRAVARGIVLDLAPTDGASRRRHLRWLDDLMDWQDDVADPNEFIEAVRADLFADDVYVFTPEGDIRTLPKGSTAIDFAFSIHTDVGLHCSGARVNGQVVPLRYRLRNGDTIEILTNPGVEPRREWLSMCKSSRARARIKQHLRQREKTRDVAAGRLLVEQRLARRGIPLARMEKSAHLNEHLEALGIARDRGVDGIYEDLGAGRIQADQVVWLVDPSSRGEAGTSSSNLLYRMLRRVAGRMGADGRRAGLSGDAGQPSAPIVIDERTLNLGAGDGLVQLAPCCDPVVGDELTGYLVPGSGIVAHTQSCPRALDHVEERRVFLQWKPGLQLDRPAVLEVRSANEVGLLAKMSRAFSHVGVDIKQANCRAIGDGKRALNTFHVSVPTIAALDRVIAELRTIRGVVGVERTFPGAKRPPSGPTARSGLPPGATETSDIQEPE